MFEFDPLGESILYNGIKGQIHLALICSGTFHIGLELKTGPARVAHGRTVPHQDQAKAEEQQRRRDADLAAGLPAGKYASYSDLVETLGEANLAALTNPKESPSAAVMESFGRRSADFQKSLGLLIEDLTSVRKRFYPDYYIADFRDGPPEYVAAIRDSIDRFFSPPKITDLIEHVRNARRKLSMLVGGHFSVKDVQEIDHFVAYVSWFIDRFDILDAPQRPSGPLLLENAREYLRSVQSHLDTVTDRRLSHDDTFSRYLADNPRCVMAQPPSSSMSEPLPMNPDDRTPSQERAPEARVSKLPPIQEKVEILFLAANPNGTTKLSLDDEFREVTNKIRASKHRDRMSLLSQWAVRPDDLIQLLNEHSPQIVHFSGHGSEANGIILVAGRGTAKTVSTKAVEELFRILGRKVRLVVLNACFSEPQAKAIVKHVDCAVGMSRSVSDKAAITFASGFYRALGFGRSIKDAFEEGKMALQVEGVPGVRTLRLLARDGVDPGTILLIDPGADVK